MKGSALNTEVLKLAQKQMAGKLHHDSYLCEKLIPKWEVGCRRITPGEGYLESFLRPNVDLTQSPIDRITSDGVQTVDGKFYPVDVGKFYLVTLSSPRELTKLQSCLCNRIRCVLSPSVSCCGPQ